MVADRAAFIELKEYGPLDTPYRHNTAGAGEVSAKGFGKAKIWIRGPAGNYMEFIINAMYNPDLDFNLLSMNQMKEVKLWWLSKDLLIRDMSDIIVGYTRIYRGVPQIDTVPLHSDELILAAPTCSDNELDIIAALTDKDILTAHRRLGHAGIPKLREALGLHTRINHFICDVCEEAKAKRQVSHEPQNIFNLDQNDPAALWYADVQTVSPKGIDGSVMYIVVVNAATRLTVVLLINQKKGTLETMIEFCKWIKLQMGQYPREWQLDGGSEFFKFRTWGLSKGMAFRPSAPRSPEQNGPSERYGGYVNGIARCNMIDSGLPARFWPYAVEHSSQVLNRLARPHEKDSRPPIQRWREHWKLKDHIPSIEHFKIFGCRAWVHIPKEDRVTSQKMSPRAHTGFYVGNEGDHGHLWRVWVPALKRVVRSRDVTFDESRTYKNETDTEIKVREETPQDERGQSLWVTTHREPEAPVGQPEQPPQPEPSPNREDHQAEGGAQEAQSNTPKGTPPHQMTPPESPQDTRDVEMQPSRGSPSRRGGRLTARGAFMNRMYGPNRWIQPPDIVPQHRRPIEEGDAGSETLDFAEFRAESPGHL
jgi:hypothetical protein